MKHFSQVDGGLRVSVAPSGLAPLRFGCLFGITQRDFLSLSVDVGDDFGLSVRTRVLGSQGDDPANPPLPRSRSPALLHAVTAVTQQRLQAVTNPRAVLRSESGCPSVVVFVTPLHGGFLPPPGFRMRILLLLDPWTLHYGLISPWLVWVQPAVPVLPLVTRVVGVILARQPCSGPRMRILLLLGWVWHHGITVPWVAGHCRWCSPAHSSLASWVRF